MYFPATASWSRPTKNSDLTGNSSAVAFITAVQVQGDRVKDFKDVHKFFSVLALMPLISLLKRCA